MKTMMNTMRDKANVMGIKAKCKLMQGKEILSDECGTGYTDVAVVVLISVVLGALLLAGLYALFGDVVLPTLEKKIIEMFNYAG